MYLLHSLLKVRSLVNKRKNKENTAITSEQNIIRQTSNIDFTFISELEGSRNQGYVPDPEQSQSGVSIAAGFDIGQRTEAELIAAFPEALCQKLLPYAGITKLAAVQILREIPLELNDEEIALINIYSHKQAEERLISSWNDVEHYDSFHSLPDKCQTVIASVAFQYGSLKLKTPNFWQQITSGDWQAAEKNLRDFGDKYPTRRNKEADLLLSWLEKKSK